MMFERPWSKCTWLLLFIALLLLTACLQRLNERGERLNDLSMKTGELENATSDFLAACRELNRKNRNKKWYQL